MSGAAAPLAKVPWHLPEPLSLRTGHPRMIWAQEFQRGQNSTELCVTVLRVGCLLITGGGQGARPLLPQTA